MGKIIKVQLQSKYMQVPNQTAKAVEKEISLQALGLLTNIMSYAETWDLHKTELYKRYAKNKRTSVKNAWDELVEANYIMECRIRNGKKWDYNYFVRLEPFSEAEQEQIKNEVEAQTPDGNLVFWDVDFGHPKMGSSKSAPNKELKKEKRTKEIQTGMYVSTDSESLNLFVENYQPTKHEQTRCIELIDKYGEELSLLAIKRTLDKGKKDNVINYITGMLDNWAKNKLKTVAEVEAYEQKYWNEKKSKKDSKQKKNKLPKSVQKAQDEIKLAALEASATITEEDLQGTYDDIYMSLKALRNPLLRGEE